MKSTVGQPRALTDEQVETILEWSQEVRRWRKWRRESKTLKAFAKELGVAPPTLARTLSRWPKVRPYRPSKAPGRPPILRDELVVAMIGAWHATAVLLRVIRKRIKTEQQMADELGVSPATIARVVATGGQYKLASPEKRSEELSLRRERISKLQARNLY